MEIACLEFVKETEGRVGVDLGLGSKPFGQN